jgi:hypothetical protein
MVKWRESSLSMFIQNMFSIYIELASAYAMLWFYFVIVLEDDRKENEGHSFRKGRNGDSSNKSTGSIRYG